MPGVVDQSDWMLWLPHDLEALHASPHALDPPLAIEPRVRGEGRC